MDEATQIRYLRAMGVEVYAPNAPPAQPAAVPVSALAATQTAAQAPAQSAAEPEVLPEAKSVAPPEVAAVAPAPAALVDVAPSDSGPAAAPAVADEPGSGAATPVSNLDWDALAATVKDCQLCRLRAGCTQTVFGVGPIDARLLVVGEGPGADEDAQGEPFVGRAGKLLDEMLLAIGHARRPGKGQQGVYIGNVVKCRPPKNRDPKPDEAAACKPYLARQIELLQPRAILAVGRIAAQLLLETDQPIGKLRGPVHRYGEAGVPVIVTYHPAYLLRSPREKRKVWTDLCALRDLLATGAAA